MKKLPAARLWKDPSPLPLEFGGELPEIEVAYETWGSLSFRRDNAILVCPAFSAHSHARSSRKDPTPGWWESMIGPGLCFDTERYFVICASLLGGCYGTTGPLSIDPESGRAYGAEFPIVSVRDMVDVQGRLVRHLGIEKLLCAAGGSLGGMESIELAVRFPHLSHRIITISATDRTRPYTASIRRIGRLAIIRDPLFKGGNYAEPPIEGLRLARELGTIYYRSRREFNQRFSCEPLEKAEIRVDGINFDFESYMNHQGGKAPKMFDANTYLRLSLAMDLHNVTRRFSSLDEALAPCDASFLVAGAVDDHLIPIEEQRGIHESLTRLGKPSRWAEITSLYGHDAFLKEFDWMTPILKSFLED